MKFADIIEINRRIEEGEWVRDIPHLPGVAVKVRGLGNKEWAAMRAKLAEERTDETDEAKAFRMGTQLILETMLLDWSGIEEADGSPLPYSRERAAEFVGDQGLKILRDGVVYAASVVGSQFLQAA